MTRWLVPAAILAAMAALAGCGKDLRQENARLRSQLVDCREQLDQSQRDTRELQDRLAQSHQQVQTLQQLGPRQLELAPHAIAIRLGRYTSAVDTDDAPGDDAVKVFVEPMDPQGHVIKAAGALLVELYDLQAPQGQNLLGRCRFEPSELSKQWFGGFATDHYSVVCPLERRPEHSPITVRVAFADLVTGRVFGEQKVVEARLAQTLPADEADSAATSVPAQP